MLLQTYQLEINVYMLYVQVSGIAVLAVGVWVKVDKNVVNMQHLVEIDSTDNALTTASTVLIIFGVGVLLIAAFGFFAACLPEKCKMGQRFFSGIVSKISRSVFRTV